jgi:hypothetical protein
MHTRAIPIVLALMLYGCGDSGRREEGDDGSTGGDDDETSGLPGIGDDTDGQDDADADGSDPIGDDAASSSSGGAPVDDGVSCEQIWDCYESCEDTDCTIACYEEGSTQAQQNDDALWECILVNDCGVVDWDCVGAHCAAEQQACFQ